MDTIRIFSKKTFAIGPGAQRGSTEVDTFITVPLSFQDMPAKYANDPTFVLACRAGDITVVQDVKPQVQVAAPVATPAATPENELDVQNGNDTDVDTEAAINEYKETLKKMSAEETKAEAEKYGAEFVEDDKLAANKKRVLEAYKLSLQ